MGKKTVVAVVVSLIIVFEMLYLINSCDFINSQFSTEAAGNFFQLLQALFVAIALSLSFFQIFSLRKELKERANEITIDRIYQIRTLLIDSDDLHKVWAGGLEGEAIEEVGDHRHFYLAKMLFHLNASLYRQIRKNLYSTSTAEDKDSLYYPWRENLKTDLTAPKFRKIWMNNRIVRESYDKNFQDEVNSIIIEIETGAIKKNTKLQLVTDATQKSKLEKLVVWIANKSNKEQEPVMSNRNGVSLIETKGDLS